MTNPERRDLGMVYIGDDACFAEMGRISKQVKISLQIITVP